MTTTNGVPQGFAGVVTVAPQSVHQSIKSQVDAALKGVKEGKTMAVLNVKTGAGLNLAIAHRRTIETGILKGGEWEVVTWVGKSGWSKPIDKGVSVSFTR